MAETIQFEPEEAIEFEPEAAGQSAGTPVAKGQAVQFEPENPGGAELRPAPEESAWTRGTRAAREALSPLIGPTERQRLAEAFDIDANGQPIYKPAGSRVDQEGLFPALSHPMVPLPRADESTVRRMSAAPVTGAWAPSQMVTQEDREAGAAWLAGLVNKVAEFAEFGESPLGVATAGAAQGPAALKRLVSGAFAADMARQVPEAARQAGEASVTGTPLQRSEAALGLGTSVVLPGLLGGHAAGPGERTAGTGPEAPAVTLPKGRVSEFGGEAAEESRKQKAESRKPEAAAEIQFEPEVAEVQTPGPAPEEARPAGALVVETVRERVRNRETVPAALVEQVNVGREVPLALPEGYTREGEQWVWKEPEAPETEAGRLAREQREAMAALRASKEEGEPLTAEAPTAEPLTPARSPAAAERGRTPTERVEAGTAMETLGERAPDVLDTIGESFPRGVKFESKADFGEYLNQARGRAAELMSHTRGEPADQVLKALHENGEYLRITNPDELAEAMVRAGAGRIGERAQRVKARAQARTEPAEVGQWAEAEQVAREQVEGEAGWIAGSAAEKWADEVLRGGATHAGPDVLAAYVVKGAALIERGVRDFAEWSGEMVRQFGETVRPHLERIYKEAAARSSQARQQAERATGLKILASAAIDQAVKEKITQYLYERRSNADDQATADGLVKSLGMEAAIETYERPPANMPGAVRSKLLGSITRGLAEQERQARIAGDKGVAERLAQRQGELWDRALPQITELAQSLQALNDLVSLSPEGQVARVKAQLERQAGEAIDGRRAEVETVRNAVEQGRQEGIERVRQDPATNQAAREAVDEAVAGSEETRRAVILDLAEEWSQAPVIVEQARELVRARAGQLLGRNPLPIGKSAGEAMRVILEDLGKRGASIAAGYFQGASQHPEGLAGLLKERLGLEQGKAEQLAKVLDREFARQLTAARLNLPKRIAAARMARETGGAAVAGIHPRILETARQIVASLDKRADAARLRLKEKLARMSSGVDPSILVDLAEIGAAHLAHNVVDFGEWSGKMLAEAGEWVKPHLREVYAASKKALDGATVDQPEPVKRALRAAGTELKAGHVDQAIRRQLRELNVKLGDVLTQEAGRQDQTGSHVAERIVQASGLTGEKADALRATLKTRWDTLVREAQVRKLEALQRASGVKVRPEMKSAFTKLVELNRLGALTSERFFDVVKKSLKLKQLSEAEAKQLRGLVEKAQEQPEGFLRERAAAGVLQFTEKLAGNSGFWDVPMAVWYTNAVSGLTTMAKIPFENSNMWVGNILVGVLSRPGELLHPVSWLRATAGAAKRGAVKGALQAESTLRTGIVTGVWEQARTNVLEGKPFGPAMEWANFHKYLARTIATAHEVTFKPAWEFKQTMLARDVARREGLKGRALEVRVGDLLANTRGEFEKAQGQAMAELASVGNPNKADLARRTREILEQRREENMPGSTATARDYALRTVYLNEPYGVLGILADGTNAMLRKVRLQSPLVGTAMKSQIPFVRVASNILNEAWNWGPGGLERAARSHWTGQLYGRGIMDRSERAEMYAKGILGTVTIGALAALAGDRIHGGGPSDPKKRAQLAAAGWIPYSIEYDGHYHAYQHTPMKFWLSVLGNWEDWRRYGKGDEEDATSRAAFLVKSASATLLNQSMMDSVRRILDAVGDENARSGGRKLQETLARTASTFVVPNLAQQADRLWDPTVYDKTGVRALVTSQIPFVRRQGKPVLNVLGEPVQSAPFHAWASTVSKDPVWRLLSEKGLYVPEPSRSGVVGLKAAGPEYYRAMTEDERYNIVAESGPRIRASLLENLARLRTLPQPEAQALVRMVADTYHQAARAKLTP